ncbi:MAG: DNA-protecting protein DprA [Pseudomonadota bacterium]
MLDQDLGAWLRLTSTPGIGRVKARRLLAAFGWPSAVFDQTPSALEPVVGMALAHRLLAPPSSDTQATLLNTQAWLAEAENRHVVAVGDPAYPADLLETADPPLLLYVLGQLQVLNPTVHRLAVVGSRNPTAQGVENARQFARALGEAGVCVVSGLSLGIDAAAHQGALAGGGSTIAVVGTGLDRVYPRQHRDLAHAIAANGALVSEYPIGTGPLAAHFPQRNRIISGLSRGTLVVEAALKSGSLITARTALEQGRDVYAIPGSIHAPQAKGCHELIKQGAQLVESAADILGFDHPTTGAGPNTPKASPDQEHAPLLAAMGHDPMGLDTLQARTGWSVEALQASLLTLELEGRVQRLPGGLYAPLVRA